MQGRYVFYAKQSSLLTQKGKLSVVGMMEFPDRGRQRGSFLPYETKESGLPSR